MFDCAEPSCVGKIRPVHRTLRCVFANKVGVVSGSAPDSVYGSALVKLQVGEVPGA
jgi:hypothetical protein